MDAEPPIIELDIEALGLALANLSYEDQVVLRLRFFGGFRNPEIAAMLDVKPGAMAVRVHRACIRLRNLLEDFDACRAV